MLEIVLSVISILGTILTIIFAYIAFRRNEKYDVKNNAKSEGALLSDIGYIKSRVLTVWKKNLINKKIIIKCY